MGFLGQKGGGATPLVITRTRTVQDTASAARADQNFRSAESWKKQAVTNGASEIAEAKLVNEILDEVDGLKPKRLSDRKNKHLRDQFREEKMAEAREKLNKEYGVKE